MIVELVRVYLKRILEDILKNYGNIESCDISRKIRNILLTFIPSEVISEYDYLTKKIRYSTYIGD
jgi:hypothetical protein